MGNGSEIFFTVNYKPEKSTRKIALVASIAWTLWNYRLSLIKTLEAAGFEVILLAAEDNAQKHLEAQTQAKFHPLHQLSRRSLSPFQNLSALKELYFAFRRHQPDLILFFTIRPNTLGNLAASLLGIPSISTVEGMGIAGASRPWLRWLTFKLYRWAFRHTSKVIFLNQDDLQEFLDLGIVTSKKAVLIHGPGIDLEHFAPWPQKAVQEPLVFLFVGRLLAEKGVREFVEAASILKKMGYEAKFQILGNVDDGNPTSIHLSELNAWTQEGLVHHLGFLEDVRPIIANSDVLVLPSYYREGVPRSILEAMALEKPIITTDNVGCRDTVIDEVNGYLTIPRNPAVLVDAMIKILNASPEQRTEMGRQSRQIALQEFGDEKVLPEYLRLVQEILDSRASTS